MVIMAASTNSYRVQLTEDVSDVPLDEEDAASSEGEVSDANLDGSNEDSNEKEEEDELSKQMRNGNPGWADAMAKVLRMKKPKGKKSIVLSKAKKLNMIKEKPSVSTPGFEIEGEIKEEKPDVTTISLSTERKPTVSVKKRDWDSKGRVKPHILDKNREKALAKIATKGVVQLFNAVREHQKNIGSQLKQAGASERKREKVLKSIDKRAFLDVLMGNTKSEIVDDPAITEPKVKKEEEQGDTPPTWEVLKEDFMMGAKFKDWDKKKKVPKPESEIVVSDDGESDDSDDET